MKQKFGVYPNIEQECIEECQVALYKCLVGCDNTSECIRDCSYMNEDCQNSKLDSSIIKNIQFRIACPCHLLCQDGCPCEQYQCSQATTTLPETSTVPDRLFGTYLISRNTDKIILKYLF